MSDFVFSSLAASKEKLTNSLHSLYNENRPDIYHYQGEWGSLAVSKNIYNGFQPLETEKHIFVVIGGPVLCFSDNSFLIGNDPTAGTLKIYKKWYDDQISWEEDLSGAYAILIINKMHGVINIITDLMMFIPVYKYNRCNELVIASHIDIAAETVDQSPSIDRISLVDFILHSAITYPYTSYQNIRQCQPASVHAFHLRSPEITETAETYWIPFERNDYKNLNEAAVELRNGLQDYVHRITNQIGKVAQFISGGEDSRAISGLLPQQLERDAFIFLDSMNREGRIAKKAADAYGLNFNVGYRGRDYYADIFEQASNMVGSGYQYIHAHTIDFAKELNLHRYPAIFGGFLSDAFLKAGSRKTWWNTKFFFLPQFNIIGETQADQIESSIFDSDILDAITARRKEHMARLKVFRPSTSSDWFEFWPATMCDAMPSFYSNRRLFRTYEPFMCKHTVKICAAVPLKWKLNRSLFHAAMKPMLKKSKWIIHTDGRLPYYSWKVNFFVGLFNWALMVIARRIKKIDVAKEGPWGDLQNVITSHKWRETVYRYESKSKNLLKQNCMTDSLFSLKDSKLKLLQKINFMQVLYMSERQKSKSRSRNQVIHTEDPEK